MIKEHDRQYKLLSLPPEAILSFLNRPRHEFMTFMRMDGLPDDYTVEEVFWDGYSRSFVFRIHSASFDPVPQGGIIPQLLAVGEHLRVRVTAQDSLLGLEDILAIDDRTAPTITTVSAEIPKIAHQINSVQELEAFVSSPQGDEMAEMPTSVAMEAFGYPAPKKDPFYDK